MSSKKLRKKHNVQLVDSLWGFLSEVDRIVQLWNPEGKEHNPWFRGHSQSSWKLTPKIYRPEFQDIKEDDLRWEFYHLAWPYLSSAAWEPKTDWDWYFLMEHYGLPIRLLDWTESALVALYFALRDTKDKKENAAVWILNPKVLNQKVAKKGYLILSTLCDTMKIKGYLPKIDSPLSGTGYPIAIQPELKSFRIAAQQGVFTLHGKDKQALDDYAILDQHLVKIEILRSKDSLIKEQLLVAGIGETTVFPELSALAQELIDYYQYKPSK
jgi:hypothetical protein